MISLSVACQSPEQDSKELEREREIDKDLIQKKCTIVPCIGKTEPFSFSLENNVFLKLASLLLI